MKHSKVSLVLLMKAIGHAFAVLGDKEKRSAYDMFGSESPAGMGRRQSNPFGAAQGFHPNSHFQHFEGDVSPEELFNMFFGAGSRGDFRFRLKGRSGACF